jgi:hypothetical protein
MLVYLDEFRKTRAGGAQSGMDGAQLRNGTYGDEVLNANWTPAVLYALPTPAPQSLSPELPVDLDAVDIEAFMSRVYALASQV